MDSLHAILHSTILVDCHRCTAKLSLCWSMLFLKGFLYVYLITVVWPFWLPATRHPQLRGIPSLFSSVFFLSGCWFMRSRRWWCSKCSGNWLQLVGGGWRMMVPTVEVYVRDKRKHWPLTIDHWPLTIASPLSWLLSSREKGGCLVPGRRVAA